MNALKQYIDLYDESRDLIEQQSPALLNKLRRIAREHLQDARLPRKGSEDYEATACRLRPTRPKPSIATCPT